MNLTTFIDYIIRNQKEYPEWRYGQVLFNTLRNYNPELAEEIRDTEADPFHADNPLDERVSNFWNFIYACRTLKEFE